MDVTRISIPGRKNTRQLSLLGTWSLFCLLLLAWMVAIVYQVTTGAEKGMFDFSSMCLLVPLILAMLVFGIHGTFAAYLFLWQFAGLETIEVSPNSLRVKKSIFGIGRTKTYEPAKITSIRLGKEISLSIAFLRFKFAQFEVPASGSIMVGIKGKKMEYTDYLGLGLTTDESEEVVRILQQQLF